MEFKNKTVLIAGLGLSGLGAASLLGKLGANLVLYDENTNINTKDFIEKNNLPEDTKIYLGEFPYTELGGLHYIILSPGITVESPYITDAKEAGVKVIGEMELAYRLTKGKVIAITGTNGKTTTTALVWEIAKNYFNSVFVVGNIGRSFAEVVLNTTDESITIAVVSSFQLETIDSFKPDVSAVLNVSPDHLDRHHTMENYLRVKMSIAGNQDENDCCILNYEDLRLRNHALDLKTRVLFFSSKNKLENGIYLERDRIIINHGGKDTEICKTSELKLLGVHNYENIMAAIAMAVNIGIPYPIIRETIIKFTGVEHRIEYVTEKKGVLYYNDSKGTNPDASIKAIEAMNTKTVLIAGGYDKGANYDEWIKSFNNKIKSLILLGQTKFKIAGSAEKLGYANILFAESLEEAVSLAAEEAKPGDAVLLSPACASWGMFKDYEQRGRMFKEYVDRI